MGEDLSAVIMGEAASRPPKTFTGSVFDTEPFNPALSQEEAIRLSRRAYAEQTTKPARRLPPDMTASPEYVGRSRTADEVALDLTAALSKGTTGFFKGILDNLPGDPGTALFEGMEQRAERAVSPITKGSDSVFATFSSSAKTGIDVEFCNCFLEIIFLYPIAASLWL
jgi:hypothetical protein